MHKKSNSQYDNLNRRGRSSSIINLNRDGYDVHLCKIEMKNETVFQKNKLNARQKNLLKKELIRTRLYTADWASFFGLIGFILMIFESEFTLYGFYTKVKNL